MKYITLLICVVLMAGCSRFENAKLKECEFKNRNIAESSSLYQAKLQIQTEKNLKLEKALESEVESRVRTQRLLLIKERESMINENNNARATLRSIFGLSIIGILISFGMINYWFLTKYIKRKPKDEK